MAKHQKPSYMRISRSLWFKMEKAQAVAVEKEVLYKNENEDLRQRICELEQRQDALANDLAEYEKTAKLRENELRKFETAYIALKENTEAFLQTSKEKATQLNIAERTIIERDVQIAALKKQCGQLFGQIQKLKGALGYYLELARRLCQLDTSILVEAGSND